jgi:formylmethanofuran dehydrogenase subunit E
MPGAAANLRTTRHVTCADPPTPAASVPGTEVAVYVEPLSQLHAVLCPRQVLGVRMALLAGRALGVPFPQRDKRVVTIAEMDGCLVDGLSVVTGCTVGHRTLRVADLGKIAATFVDMLTERAVRVAPRPGVRAAAQAYAADSPTRWHAQRDGYASMPVDELLSVVDVRLRSPVADLLGDWEGRVTCERCAEEVIGGRQVVRDDLVLCRHCAGEGYVDAG